MELGNVKVAVITFYMIWWREGDRVVDAMVQVAVCIPSCCNLLDFDHSNENAGIK